MASILAGGIGQGVAALSGLARTIVNAIAPDKAQQEKDAATLQIQQLIAESEIFKGQAGIVQAEVASSNWLAASWRPITMLTFLALIVARFLGFDAKAMTPDDYTELWGLIKIGLGGYVVARSAEKITPAIAQAIAQAIRGK
jgi:hypothetical protein